MNIRDRAKDVAQAAHEIKSLELSQRIANLHSDIVALVEENLRLNDENKELKETLRLKREMKYKEPFYFLDGDETPLFGSKSSPCCSCFSFLRGQGGPQGRMGS